MAINFRIGNRLTGASAKWRKCRRCQKTWGTCTVHADRLSRSENYRKVTIGVYCEKCAKDLITEKRHAETVREGAG